MYHPYLQEMFQLSVALALTMSKVSEVIQKWFKSIKSDPYNIKHDLINIVSHQYKPCGKKCDSFYNFVTNLSYVISNATGREYYIRQDSTCSTPNVVYMPYCKKYKKQGVGFPIWWKPRLRNYKSYIKKNVRSCKIVIHFIAWMLWWGNTFQVFRTCHYWCD